MDMIGVKEINLDDDTNEVLESKVKYYQYES